MKLLVSFLFLASSLTGYTQNKKVEPAYIIDGVLNADIRSISPDDLFDFSFLKGKQDTVRYGTNAKYGVAFITTKKFAQNAINGKLSAFSNAYEIFTTQKHVRQVIYRLNNSIVPDRTIFYLPKEKIKSVEFVASETSPEVIIKSSKFTPPKRPVGQVYIRGAGNLALEY